MFDKQAAAKVPGMLGHGYYSHHSEAQKAAIEPRIAAGKSWTTFTRESTNPWRPILRATRALGNWPFSKSEKLPITKFGERARNLLPL
jgi:hypothetical protein